MARRVTFNETDAGRISKAVRAYERGNRDMPPIKFRTVSDEGGSGLPIRLARFAGAWTNDPLMGANVKNVMLYRKVIPADPLVPEDPNEWEPELDAEGFPIVVTAVNLLAWAGSAQQDVLKWCYVTKASTDSQFWIMIGAEC